MHSQEGQISEAENMKLKLEQNQRDRRAAMEEAGEKHVPKWFKLGQHDNREEADNEDYSDRSKSSSNSTGNKDRWVFTTDYWREREDPGFTAMPTDAFIKLW